MFGLQKRTPFTLTKRLLFGSRWNSTNNINTNNSIYQISKNSSNTLSSPLIDAIRPNFEKSELNFKPRKKFDLIDKNDLGPDPRRYAQELRITGPIAGRMVSVIGENGTNAAFRKLKTLIYTNEIKTEKFAQRFYKKPGKVLEEKRIRRKKKLFDEGIRRLMNLVKEAKRRGY